MSVQVSMQQLELLLNFMEKNHEVAACRYGKSKEGRVLIRRLWISAADLLNTASQNCAKKTPDQWRQYFNEYKHKMRKQIAAGSCRLMPLQERFNRILNIYPTDNEVKAPPPPSSLSNSVQLSDANNADMSGHSGSPAPAVDQKIQEGSDEEANKHVKSARPFQRKRRASSDINHDKEKEEPSRETAEGSIKLEEGPSPQKLRLISEIKEEPCSGEETSMDEDLKKMKDRDRDNAEATRELARATNRLAAAFEVLGQRLWEPIIVVHQGMK